MKAHNLFFKECHIAGRQYHDADEVWGELKVGTRVYLERDYENKFDPYAVAVVYKKQGEDAKIEDFMLGYIPNGENSLIAGLLEMGWDKIFTCSLSKIDPEAHYEQQLHITIKIKRNE